MLGRLILILHLIIESVECFNSLSLSKQLCLRVLMPPYNSIWHMGTPIAFLLLLQKETTFVTSSLLS